MKYPIVALIAAFAFSQAYAEPMTANQGLDKIKSNLEAARKNKTEYNRNLELVNANINEIKKAKDAVLKQKKNVSGELVKNNDSVNKISVQEREINLLILKEKEKMAQESKQLTLLEGLVTQVKRNQEQRQQILLDYQQQLAVAQSRKAEWKEREGILRSQEAKTTESLRSIASDETSWGVKKQKYDKETKTWTAEAGKQQKTHDSYQGLANGN